MLKAVLKNTLEELNTRLNRDSSIMKECVSKRLEDSIELYQDNLLDTCKYVLSRNPVIMMKDLNKE